MSARIGSGEGGVPSVIARAVAIALSLLLVVFVLRRVGTPPEPEEPPARAQLRAWDLLGCYELEAGAWERAAGEPDAPAGAGGPGPSVPGRVMLAADSVDAWGRRLASYRAVDLGAERDPSRSLRWFVRADTLWIVWSGSGLQGGAALFAEGDSLRGLARVSGRDDSLDVSARVTAWRFNCATLGREPSRRGPRR